MQHFLLYLSSQNAVFNNENIILSTHLPFKLCVRKLPIDYRLGDRKCISGDILENVRGEIVYVCNIPLLFSISLCAILVVLDFNSWGSSKFVLPNSPVFIDLLIYPSSYVIYVIFLLSECRLSLNIQVSFITCKSNIMENVQFCLWIQPIEVGKTKQTKTLMWHIMVYNQENNYKLIINFISIISYKRTYGQY